MVSKKLLIFTAFLLGTAGALKAQGIKSLKTDSVYSKVDVQPEFPGGMKALGKYVDGRNHFYPKEARDNKKVR